MTFSAWQSGKEVSQSVHMNTSPHSVGETLQSIKNGFETVISSCSKMPAAISMGFPGPCDYKLGIVGNLPNFPDFNGELALGPYLEEKFKLPVIIENDGNLFTLGEYSQGYLPYVNGMLESHGNPKRYKNLIGVTIGTGFGCGIVINGTILSGDNNSGGEIWNTASSLHPGECAEAYVGGRYLSMIYNGLAGNPVDKNVEPVDLYAIACNNESENKHIARQAFSIMGAAIGDAIANCLSIIDGLVVIGGGIAAAYDLFIDAALRELNGSLNHKNGIEVRRIAHPCYNFDHVESRKLFLADEHKEINIPGSSKNIRIKTNHNTAVGRSRLDTSKAICLGAFLKAEELLA